MIEEDSKALNIILEDICHQCSGTHVFAIDMDGLPISAYSLSGYFEFEISAHIAALVAAIFETGIELGMALNYSDLDFTFSLHKQGVMMVKRIENILLILFIPEKKLNVEDVYKLLVRYESQLEPLIPSVTFVEDSAPVNDMKNLFASELDNFDPDKFL